MKVKQTILIFLFALMGVNAWAEDSKIIVWLNDGSTKVVPFEEMPEFVYADGRITLKSDQEELSWPLADLQKFTFESVSSIPKKGDVDNNKLTTVQDVVGMVNIIAGKKDGLVIDLGDMNDDRQVYIADIIQLVNLLIK